VIGLVLEGEFSKLQGVRSAECGVYNAVGSYKSVLHESSLSQLETARRELEMPPQINES
jgi:hypothetical protein